MNLIPTLNIMPKPLRNIFYGINATKEGLHVIDDAQPGSVQAALIGILGPDLLFRSPPEEVIKAALRIAVATLGFFAFQFTGGFVVVASVLGSLISLPAVAIVGSASLFVGSLSAAASALATGSLTSLGISLGCLASGMALSELHDIVPFGIGEMAFSWIAANTARDLVRAIKG